MKDNGGSFTYSRHFKKFGSHQSWFEIILTKWDVYVSWCACGLKSPSCSAPFEENAPIANRTYNFPFKKRTLVIKNCEIMVHFIQYS